MMKAIILLGVTCPTAWALPTAHIQTTLSSDAHDQTTLSSDIHDQKTLSSDTLDQKTLGQKTPSEDSHDQKVLWTESESETALLGGHCGCKRDWGEWDIDCSDLPTNCGKTATKTATPKSCARSFCNNRVRTKKCRKCKPPSSPPPSSPPSPPPSPPPPSTPPPSPPPPSTPPTDWEQTTSGPIAWGHSGGGTRAFFSAMAIARAMVADGLDLDHEKPKRAARRGALSDDTSLPDNTNNHPGLLGKLDYIGSISGSSWFTNLLGYDEDFFNEIKKTDKPIGQVVSDFGDRWEQKMSDEHASWRAQDTLSSRAEAIEQFITFGAGFDKMQITWNEDGTDGFEVFTNIGKFAWNMYYWLTKGLINKLSVTIETYGEVAAQYIDFFQHFQTKLPADRYWQRFVEHYILGGAGTNDPGRFDANNVQRNGLKTTKLITLMTLPPDVYVEAPTKAEVPVAAMQLELLQKLNHSMHQSLQNSDEELFAMIPSAFALRWATRALAMAGGLNGDITKYLAGKALDEVMEWLAGMVPLPAKWFGLDEAQSTCDDVIFSNKIDLWREFWQLRRDLKEIGADVSHPADNDFWEKLMLSKSFWLGRLGFMSGAGQQTSTLKIASTLAADETKIDEFKAMKAALPMAWVVEKKEVGGNCDAIPAVPVTTDKEDASYFIASDMVDIHGLEAEFSCNAEPGNKRSTKKLDLPTSTNPPKVGTMSAGSSSALGYLSSPQMVEVGKYGAFLKGITGRLGHLGHILGTSLKGQRGVSDDNANNKAHPGLIKFMGDSVYGHGEDRADYRLIDGCYVDNSGIAFTVAAMQKDAIALGTAEQNGPKRMRLIGTSYSAKNDDDTVMQVLFANPQHDTTGWRGKQAAKSGNVNAKFQKWQQNAKDRNMDLSELKGGKIGPTSSNGGAVGSAPLPQVFAERYPEVKCATGLYTSEHEACWTDLNTGRITAGNGNGQYKEGTEDSQTRGYWSTLLHTVDNDWWNIEGDWEIDVLMLQPQCNVKTTAWPADQYKLWQGGLHGTGQVTTEGGETTYNRALNQDGVYFRQIECADMAYKAYTEAGIFKKFFYGGSKCVNDPTCTPPKDPPSAPPLLSSPSPPPPPPPPPRPPRPLAELLPSHANEALQIGSKQDNKVWDDDGHGKVYMGDSHAGSNQRFFIHQIDDTYFQMKIESKPDKCLDYHMHESKIYIGDCHSGTNQLFYFVDGMGKGNMDGASNAAKIGTKYYGDTKVLDYNYHDGSLYFHSPHNGANQLFYFKTS